MTAERFALLNQLDFAWVVRAGLEHPRASWQQRFEELVQFYGRNGHFKVDASSMPQLNKFCLDQRYRLRLLKKKKGIDVTKRMGLERVRALARIGFTLETEILDKDGEILCDLAGAEANDNVTLATELNSESASMSGSKDSPGTTAPSDAVSTFLDTL